MVVGGYAVMTYTEPRYTKDLDSWVNPTPRIQHALTEPWLGSARH